MEAARERAILPVSSKSARLRLLRLSDPPRLKLGYSNVNPNRNGYGLDLAIARRAIESHGGTIRARNLDGGGLRVEIYLPLTVTMQSG